MFPEHTIKRRESITLIESFYPGISPISPNHCAILYADGALTRPIEGGGLFYVPPLTTIFEETTRFRKFESIVRFLKIPAFIRNNFLRVNRSALDMLHLMCIDDLVTGREINATEYCD